MVYNLITLDHSFIANKICVSDNFPNIEENKEVSLYICNLLELVYKNNDINESYDTIYNKYYDTIINTPIVISNFNDKFRAMRI